MFKFINIELTSRCNATCGMCGRRKMERDYPELCKWGDMDFTLLESIGDELNFPDEYNNPPEPMVIQFHNNGEPTLYPRLGEALALFDGHIRSFNTNAKLIFDRRKEIIGNMEVLVISVVENDRDQQSVVTLFNEAKGDKKPRMVYRLLGDVDAAPWEQMPGMIVKRVLHNPMGSRDYVKPVVKPEIGICCDMLNHPAIDRYGNFSICVRFDPQGVGRLGNLYDYGIDQFWNGYKRREWLQLHIDGKRDQVPLCRTCEYWGCPNG